MREISSEQVDIMLNMINELDDRRDSDLKPVLKFTKDMDLYKAVSKQMKHVRSELDEVGYEINKQICNEFENPFIAAMELVDLQTSCETLLAILGYNEQQRRDLRKMVIEKNAVRGYYED